MSYKFTFDHYWNDEDVEVTYTASKFIAQTWMQPAEGGEIEILSVMLGKIDVTDQLTDEELDNISDVCSERLCEDIAEERAAYEDYKYDQWRDQQMEEKWNNG